MTMSPPPGASLATGPQPTPDDAPAYPPREIGSPIATMVWGLLEDGEPTSADMLAQSLETLIMTWKKPAAKSTEDPATRLMVAETKRGIAVLEFAQHLLERNLASPVDAWRIAIALLDPEDDKILVDLKSETRRFLATIRQGFGSKDAILRTCAELEAEPAPSNKHMGEDTQRSANLLKRIVHRYFDACKDPAKVPAHHMRFVRALWALCHNSTMLEFARAFEDSRVIVESFEELSTTLRPLPKNTPPAWGKSPKRIF